jgi:hypothetical protein
MIDYAIGRHDWYENQRNRFATIALTTIGFAAAFEVGLSDPTKFALAFRIAGTLFVISIAFTALCVLWQYLEVSEKSHPYRKLADIRSWYFRYVGVSDLEEDFDSLSVQNQGAELKKLGELLKTFVEKWQAYATEPSGFEREDLQQVFILFVLQSYRQKNLKQMITTIKVGSVLSGLLLASTAITGLIVHI